jgi:ribose transport system ATP-binding protein
MADDVLQISAISKRFPGVIALDQVGISFREAEVHALVGENGAGKSTLIKILGGVFAPDSGSITLRGNRVDLGSPHKAQSLGIGVVHQELVLVPNLSAAENIMLGFEECNALGLVRFGALRRRAREAVARLGVRLDLGEKVSRLDAASQKLVQIAKATVSRPSILILDEPTAPLDAAQTDALFGAIEQLKAAGGTVIYISHRLEEVFRIADRVTVLKDGRVVDTTTKSGLHEDELVRMMIGRELGDLFPSRQQPREHRRVLRVQGLSYRRRQMRNISFTVGEGEVVGFAGLKGQGQDTLLKLLFGALPRSGGEVVVDGRPLPIGSRPPRAIAAGLALITDKRAAEGLCTLLSLEHNMALPTLRRRQTVGLVRFREEQETVRGMIADLNIQTPSARKMVQHLSGGNQQKVIIGKWLMARPRVLMFIEPTLGIDVGAKAEVYRLVRRLADATGLAVLLVTSDMLELLGMCDRILVMYNGRIVRDLPRGEATEELITRAAVGRDQGSAQETHG